MFPWTFLKKLKDAKLSEELALELFHQYSEIHRQMTNSANLVTTLQEDNKRLKHENEFMLKLIDKHMIGLNEGMDKIS